MLAPNKLFGLLGDQTRLRCLALLMDVEELCVCEFIEILQLTQTKISRHLSLLRLAGIVVDERRGLWIYYRLNPNLPLWAKDVLKTTASIIHNQEPFFSDKSKLSKEDRCDSKFWLFSL